jgi:hypothetical protein
MANAFGRRICSFPTAQSQTKKSKRATKPTHQDSIKMNKQSDIIRRSTTGNTGLAKVAFQCSADTFVANQSLVHRINICDENRHLRQSRNRFIYKFIKSPKRKKLPEHQKTFR